MTFHHGSVRSLIAGLAIAAPFLMLGCDDPSRPTPPFDPRVDPAWVTGEAAAALDRTTGRFNHPAVAGRHVSADAARIIAVAAERRVGDAFLAGNIRTVLAEERGAPIAFGTLSPCGRPLYVTGPHGSFPVRTPAFLVRAVGPQWAVSLCGRDGKSQLSIGVPDGPISGGIVHGYLVLAPIGGGSDFTTTGVPVRYASGLPVTAEAAVAAVARSTGRRITRVPVAFNQLNDGAGQLPLCASWRVEVDEPVDVRSQVTGNIREARELFIRNIGGCFSDVVAMYVAAPTQPPSRRVAFSVSAPSGLPTLDSIDVPLTGPTAFERVTIVGAGPRLSRNPRR